MKIQYQDNTLTVFESALFRTTTTCILTPDLVLLVDPNWLPIEIEFIKKYVDKIKKDRPLYLLFTHSDYDHIIGYAAFPEAKVIASKAFQENPNSAAILQQIKDFDDEYYIKRPYLTTYPEVDIVINQEGQQLTIGQTTLYFFDAKGHNADGLFTILPKEGIWIAGDYLSNIEFPYIYYSSKAYEAVMAKIEPLLEQFASPKLITGHGDMAFTKEEICLRRDNSLQYIDELRKSVSAGYNFDLNKLFQQYHFPKIMRTFHEGNIKLIKKEICNTSCP